VPPELLFELQPSGFPPHRLELKENAPIIVLRNLNQRAGVANGTRAIVKQCRPHTLIVKLTRFNNYSFHILFELNNLNLIKLNFSGPHAGDEFSIPRIKLISDGVNGEIKFEVRKLVIHSFFY
jgi:hypothetical protein